MHCGRNSAYSCLFYWTFLSLLLLNFLVNVFGVVIRITQSKNPQVGLTATLFYKVGRPHTLSRKALKHLHYVLIKQVLNLMFPWSAVSRIWLIWVRIIRLPTLKKLVNLLQCHNILKKKDLVFGLYDRIGFILLRCGIFCLSSVFLTWIHCVHPPSVKKNVEWIFYLIKATFFLLLLVHWHTAFIMAHEGNYQQVNIAFFIHKTVYITFLFLLVHVMVKHKVQTIWRHAHQSSAHTALTMIEHWVPLIWLIFLCTMCFVLQIPAFKWPGNPVSTSSIIISHTKTTPCSLFSSRSP